jgi:filamentous hemagglutinin family protein
MIRIAVLLALAVPLQAGAQPAAPRMVPSGSATFPTPAAPLTISTTPGSIINWQQYSVGTDTVKFSQPAPAAPVLNRTLGSRPVPQIQGIMLTNPSGLPVPAFAGVQVQPLMVRPNSATEAVRKADGGIVFRATPQ